MLDLRTAFLASFIVDVSLVATATGVFVSYRKVVKCTHCWLIAFAAAMIGHGFLALRNLAPDFITVVLANALMAAGLGAAIVGAAAISGHRAPYRALGTVLAVFIPALVFYSLFRDDLRIRSLIINALVLSGSVLGAAYLAYPKASDRVAALRPGATAFVALAVLYACRLVAVASVGIRGDWMNTPDWDVMIYIASIGVFAGVGFGYLRMIDGLLAMDLRSGSEENALLLKELRHRSKNNLALISSLVSLQAESVRKPETRAALDALQDRIRTISTVYRLLSNANGARHADAGEYLRAVAAGIRDGLTTGRNIAFKVEAERLELDTAQLVPLGLIVNELATNAVKHAFPDGRQGTIGIRLAAGDGAVELRVSDDGIGRPLEEDGHGGLGLTLTRAFAAQLRGRLEREEGEGPGMAFLLRFPLGR